MFELSYKGYIGKVEYDSEDDLYYGEIANIKDNFPFLTRKADKVETEFRETVDCYIDFCKEIGKTPAFLEEGSY